MTTKGESISRVRNLIKASKQDSFITDRFLYSLILKYAKLFIKRKDDSNKLGRYTSLYQKLAGIELIEVSKIEAGCLDIQTCCTFYRTKYQLPLILEGSFGPIIRSVSSIDGSKQFYRTYPSAYSRMTKSSTFKYNKNKYYWLINGYAYFPNSDWPAVDFEAMWENDISEYECGECGCCSDRREEKTNIPDDLFAEIESPVRQELFGILQIPEDTSTDNRNLAKS